MNSDFLVIGSGIAAASIGYFLAPHGRVTLLERESQPGYHSTGRSAALFLASYGTEQVRALTRASRAFLDAPPAGFADVPILSPRGALFVATPDQADLLDEHCALLQAMSPLSQRLNRDQTLALVPVLRPELLLGGALEPDASDIDVHALHQGYLKGLRRHGGTLVCEAEATHIERHGNEWIVQAGGREYRAPLLVNAAGAWCDEVARLAGVRPIGLQPKRRSAFIFAPPAGLDVSRWPSVVGADESWYFKPDAGLLLGSPANADPVDAQDVQPEELDIATAASTASRRTPRCRSAGPRAPGRGCAASSPMATWWVASMRRCRASSGWRRKAATASRPRPRWARPARRCCAAKRCPSTWPTSGSRLKCFRRHVCSLFEQRKPMRVFSASLATETNTFAPMPTGMATFRERGYWKAGDHPEYMSFFAGPLWAARQRGKPLGWTLIEGMVAGAQPSGTTTRAAYEALREELLADLQAALPVDMVLLGLHGAMVADGYDDCEGDLLQRVRAIVGPKVVVGAELDPHHHLSEAMVNNADVLVAFKEYPHTDILERALELVDLCVAKHEGRIAPRGQRGRLPHDRHHAHLARPGARLRRPDHGAGGQGRHPVDQHRARLRLGRRAGHGHQAAGLQRCQGGRRRRPGRGAGAAAGRRADRPARGADRALPRHRRVAGRGAGLRRRPGGAGRRRRQPRRRCGGRLHLHPAAHAGARHRQNLPGPAVGPDRRARRLRGRRRRAAEPAHRRQDRPAVGRPAGPAGDGEGAAAATCS